MKPISLDFSDHEAVMKLFNEAFQHPRRRYTIHPVDKDVAATWLRENTWMTNFTFEKRLNEAGALRCGELIHLDELYYRERCGWAAGHYHCDHPDKEDAAECEDGECEECEEW
jgi:hypothetical protein